MIKLSPKQEIFAQEIVKGANQTEAHRIAYPDGNYSEKQRWEEASKISRKPNVSQRIEELKAPAIKKLNITVERLLQEIEDLKTNQDKKLTLDCIKEQGKLAGLYVEKRENKDTTDYSSVLEKLSTDKS